jgi:hypothetical protein
LPLSALQFIIIENLNAILFIRHTWIIFIILVFQDFDLIWKSVLLTFSYIFQSTLTDHIIWNTSTLLIVNMPIISKDLVLKFLIMISRTYIFKNVFELTSLLRNAWLILWFCLITLTGNALSIVWNRVKLIAVFVELSI